ncbi:MAG: hypothetical protein ACLFVW_01985 [Phycisphaerae bacterium]
MAQNRERTGVGKVAMSQVAEVAREVELKDIRVVSFAAEQRPELIGPKMDVRQGIDTETTADAEAGEIRVTARFTADALPLEQESADVAVRIAVTFELAYHCEAVEGLSEEALEAFGKINGVYNSWPYWREFVHSTTARMGLPPLIMPVFRLSDHLPAQSKQKPKEDTPSHKSE